MEWAAVRRSAKYRHRCADFHGVEKRNRAFFGHTHTTVRGRITGQIPGVHSVCAREAHKVAHRRGNKLAAGRNPHVRVGVGDDGVAVGVDDLAIDARIMVSLLLEDFE